jgi:hypothetical protein
MALRKTSPSRSFMLPLLWVFLLIATYWLLSEWRDLPAFLAALKAAFLHWPK